MQRLFILVVFAWMFAAGLSSCGGKDDDSFTSVRSDRANLIQPFQSYERSSMIQERLRSDGFPWTVLEKSSTIGKTGTRPQFDIYVIKVTQFNNFGFEGTLRLEFFNDRLMSTWFYPKDSSSYRALMESHYPELRTQQVIQVDQHTRIEFGVDHNRDKYMSWEDKRLREEFDLWIKRYS